MIKTIKKNVLLENKYFKVENNKVLFKGKHEDEHLRVIPTTREGVGVLPITKEGNVIIQDEFRYSYNGLITQVVKGGLKEGQTPEQAAKEELEEELSLSYKKLIPLGNFIEHPSIVCQKGYSFLAIGCEHKEDSLLAENSECFKNKRVIYFKDLLEEVMNNKIDCAVTQMLVLKANEYIKRNNIQI
jgi:8-oxo-dGTP pyrophosphatase MutT (NUDIX family)